MKRIVCIALLLFVVFCVVARGQVYTLPRQPAHEIATKALGEALACGDLTRAEKHAREALLAWPDDQTAALVVKLVEERRAKESMKPNLVPKPAVPATTEQAGRPEVVIARAKPDPVEEVKPRLIADVKPVEAKLADVKQPEFAKPSQPINATFPLEAQPADAKQPDAPKPGQPVQVTVPPQPAPVVNVTAPEPAPTLTDQITKLILQLSGIAGLLFSIYQQVKINLLHQKTAAMPDVPAKPVAPRQMTDEEFAAEARRRFPTKG